MLIGPLSKTEWKNVADSLSKLWICESKLAASRKKSTKSINKNCGKKNFTLSINEEHDRVTQQLKKTHSEEIQLAKYSYNG